MGDLVGDSVYESFGVEFPLLIKFIDAADDLSIQVHPGDAMARERHKSYGKSEMWYIIGSDNGELIAGFNRELDKGDYLSHVKNGTLKEIINREKVHPGEIYYMPAGRVHAIGTGVLLAEIQQCSDVTYRIYDWDRVDDTGKPRELHNDLALDAIDFQFHKEYKTRYQTLNNSTVKAVDSPFFITSVIIMDKLVEKDFNLIDSFVIYMCMEGEADLVYAGGNEKIIKGETVLIPAELKNMSIIPAVPTTLLEVYIK